METAVDDIAMAKYPAYKKSGVEWLGEVPEHWEITKIKWLFFEKQKTSNIELNCGSISFGKVILKDDERIPHSTKKSYQVVAKGDFLVNPLNLNYDLISLRIALSDLDVVVSSGYIVLNTRVDLNKIYYKWLLHRFDVAYMKVLGSGVRQTLNYADIGECGLILPPKEEQDRIAQFLDTKTAQIDKAIGIKEKQVELLKERRQVLIHKAVTRGLNPNLKLKPSGIEWIGDIPEHWEVKKLKHFVDVQGGYAFDSANFKTEGVQIIKIANTYMNELCLDRQPTYVDTSFLKSHKNWVVSKGDILMSLTGTLGKKDYGFAILIDQNEKYLLNQRVAKITVKIDAEAHYILNILQSEMYLNQLYMLPSGTKQANLSNDNVLNIKIAYPMDKHERNEIIQYINDMKSKIAKAISCKEKEIEKLKEYKASLINSAVTGKIKVC